ncbi:hypothetical protein MLD38_005229 [Melastoma candidum]|uniref:Uncharacterized protein n=1 Tax=Melastoma candidum TaxID=119954 RepID=A0ACB9S7D9_9MYRT|nr:hypothetical protein MLD38_005229 [Melastoma candidum]
MGRAGRWLKGFLGFNKGRKPADASCDQASHNHSEDDGFDVASFSSFDLQGKDRKRWSFSSRSYKVPGVDRARLSRLEKERAEEKLAEAAAKAADVAVVAARAAVVIVRLMADGGSRRVAVSCGGRESWAALKIQAVFRGFLARKALKALKGIVKLQALIRGYMTRKETAAAVRTMHALARARAAAPSQWPRRSLDKENRLHPGYWHSLRSIERCDVTRSVIHSKRYLSWDRIEGEISTGSPNTVAIDHANPHIRLSKLNWRDVHGRDAYQPSTARGSSLFRGLTSYCDPATPTRSLCRECSAFKKHACLDHPSYMASTQSSQAKLRCASAPKQRPMSEWPRHRTIALREIMAARNSVTGV